MGEKQKHILDMGFEEWEEYILGVGEKKYRAGQIFDWLHHRHVLNINEFSNIPESLRARLREDFDTQIGEIRNHQKSDDGTEKILLELPGGKSVEAVLLRNGDRKTVCVSTQAGCSLYCDFCMTARGKFQGNLSAGEILEQVYIFAALNPGERISNVVFMGMGEPFMNYENTLKACHLLYHPKGMAIGSRKITISTAGVLPAIRKFAEDGEPFNLALSIHSVNPEVRERLMDSEKRWPINEILDYLEDNRYTRLKNRVTVEYIMISGLNMSAKDAADLARACRRIGAKVSLIPLNFEFDNFRRPDEGEIDEFWHLLKSHGVEVFNRSSQGYDILAACGMLKNTGR